MMHRNKSVNIHDFSMVPRADIPRSSFRMEKTYKTTFDGAFLVPVFCEEVLPGDTFSLDMTAFARLATPLFPFMDNMYLECQWFFCPNRLVWTNWQRFMGERDPDPDSSIDYLIPQQLMPAAGYAINSLQDYLGLPTAGQVGGLNEISHSALPLRMYNLIWNEWYRDQNLQDSAVVDKGDGPDSVGSYLLRKRGKRHDYFTACLPSPQKGVPVPVPLVGQATVRTSATDLVTGTNANPIRMFIGATGLAPINNLAPAFGAGGVFSTGGAASTAGSGLYPTNLYADLTTATTTTVNAIRQSFQIQKLLERDARSGTRYTEVVRAHFGVISPDARLQRPEYLGGGSTPIAINPVAQTSATAADGTDTPQGTLSAVGTGLLRSGFTQAFTEHGYVMCLVSVRCDLTYQQGLRRHWRRSTRYDYYFPVFAMLGEQAVLSREIYAEGHTDDDLVFGYQERWAEYRYTPNEITGLFRSTAAQTIDPWHLAENFATRPSLNASFIIDPAESTITRAVAVGSAAGGQQFLFDAFYRIRAARPMPMYSVPGMTDHF